MDLIQITNILKELIKTNFQNESDLKMLMQLMELIVVQYKRTNKLPGRFVYLNLHINKN